MPRLVNYLLSLSHQCAWGTKGMTIIKFVGTTSKRTRGNPAEHSSMGHVAHKLSVRIPSGGHMTFLNSSSGDPTLLSGRIVQTQR